MEKRYIMLAVGILAALCGIASVSAVKYTPYTMDDEQGHIVISGSVRYVQENEKWIDVKDAKSLKDILYSYDGRSCQLRPLFNIVYIEQDPRYVIDIIDFNYTCVKVNIKSEFGKDASIPFKIDENSRDYAIKDKEELALDDICFEDGILGHNLTFGFNSTKLSFQDAENLEDIELRDNSGSTRYGSQIKWDITSIPAGQRIDDATLCVYYHDYNAAPCDSGVVWNRINNQTWNSLGLAAHINSLALQGDNSTTFNSTAFNTYMCFNVTHAIKTDYDASNDNSSIRFEDDDYALATIVTIANGNDLVIGVWDGNPPTAYNKFRSELAGGNTPVLEIFYSDPSVMAVTPTVPANQTYNDTTIRIKGMTADTANVSFSFNGAANTTICTNCVTFSGAYSTGVNANAGNRLDVYAVAYTDPTNVDNATIFLSVDTTDPTVIVATPTHKQIFRENASIDYTFSATDYGAAASGISACRYILSGQANETIAGCNNASITSDVESAGNYSFNVFGIDSVDNQGNDSIIFNYDPYLNFSVNDSITGVDLQSFTLVHANTSNVWTTANGSLNIPLSELGIGTQELAFSSNTYNTTIYYVTITNTSKFNNTYPLYPASVSIRVFDEVQAALGIFTNITFNATMYNSSYSNTWTNQGLLWARVNETPIGDVTVDLSAAGYTSRRYYLWINYSAAQTFDLYMLKTSDSLLVRFHTVTPAETPITSVLVEARRFINSTYTMIGQQYTDESGVAAIYLYPFATYQIVASKIGYNNVTLTLQPSSSDYKIYMGALGSANPFSTSISNVSMLFTPETTSVNASYIEFVCLAFASDDSLEYVGMSIEYFNGTYFYINSTATSSGVRLNYTADLRGLNGTNLTATCGFMRDGYGWYNVSRTYYIYYEGDTLIGSAIGGAIANVSKMGLSILSILITAMAMGFIGKISGNTAAAAVGGMVVLGLLTLWLGWFDWLTFTLIALTLAALGIMRGRGAF